MGFPFCKKCRVVSVYDKQKDGLCNDCRPKKVEHYDATEHVIVMPDPDIFKLSEDIPEPTNTGWIDSFTGDGGDFSGGGSSGGWGDD